MAFTFCHIIVSVMFILSSVLDGEKPGYIVINPGWKSGDKFSFTARAEAYADYGETLNDWVFKLEFDIPVDEMEVHLDLWS